MTPEEIAEKYITHSKVCASVNHCVGCFCEHDVRVKLLADEIKNYTSDQILKFKEQELELLLSDLTARINTVTLVQAFCGQRRETKE
jgi:hypothetical protein